MGASKDYYELLGVRRDSSTEVIEGAYKALMRIYHPDRNNDPNERTLSTELTEAYAVLKDPAKRAAYDRALREQAAAARSTSLTQRVEAHPGEEREASRSNPRRRCPQCAEEIQELAKVCRYCGWGATAGPSKGRRIGRTIGLLGLGGILMLVLLFIIGSLAEDTGFMTVSRSSDPGGLQSASSDVEGPPLNTSDWLAAEQCRSVGIDEKTTLSLARDAGTVINVATGEDGNLYQVGDGGICKLVHDQLVPVSPRALARELGKQSTETKQVTLPENSTFEEDVAIIDNALGISNDE